MPDKVPFRWSRRGSGLCPRVLRFIPDFVMRLRRTRSGMTAEGNALGLLSSGAPASLVAGARFTSRSVVEHRGDLGIVDVALVVVEEAGVDMRRHGFALGGRHRGLDRLVADADRVLGDGA